MDQLNPKDYSRLVLDTSIIIDGKATAMVAAGDIATGSKIIVPVAALDELQSQASKHREEGFVGLEELSKLRELCNQRGVRLEFSGQRPSMEDIRLARNGRIDAIIRDVAKDNDALLLTADYVQALVGKAQDVKVLHLPAGVKASGLRFEAFFDNTTLSVHLKADVKPFSKRGQPGNFVYGPISEKELPPEELEEIAKEILEGVRVSPHGAVEISRSGATVLQLGNYRIAIARPPFSDALEVTIVRPLVRLSLSDYNLSEKLEQRLSGKAEGILIAGPPGSGKSTLASSLADFYLGLGKVVKTFESPKDLQVSKGITQYGALEGDFEKTAELLLLVRPDYTIFDEVRRSRDFATFADMRLAGVGMVGVVHASDPVNAVQRFMSRMELGMVPHVVDTVIFVKAGKIQQVLELQLVVKVPSGMNEPDLARPVVEVRDFESGRLDFEIYTFGEENVVIPIQGVGEKKASSQPVGVEKLALERIVQFFSKYDPKAKVRILGPTKAQVFLSDSVIPRVIGKGGEQIREIEGRLSLRIDVKPLGEFASEEIGGEKHAAVDTDSGPQGRIRNGHALSFDYVEKGNSLEVIFDSKAAGKHILIYADDELLLETQIGRKAKLKFSKKSESGRNVLQAFRQGRTLRVTEN